MMFSTPNRVTILLSLAGLIALASAGERALGATDSARQSVRTGLKQHLAGEYAAAAESFAAAGQALPEEPLITYDRACALAAQGKRDEATELFQQAALAREPHLAASSHYNLGCLAAQQAKELFGDKAEEADAATREQGVQLLQEAVMHYRDCLRVDSNHESARKNLELLRLWIKHMDEMWAQRDREKRRAEMDLLQLLEWIEAEQRSLEAATQALGEIDRSPRQRQAIAVAENSQRQLASEIEPLQQKLEATLAGEPPADATTAQAAQALRQLAQQVKSAMFRAADDLAVRELPSALTAQRKSLDSLNEIYRAVAPYEHVLQKAIKSEQSLVDTTVSILDEEADESLVDLELVSRDQAFIAGWSETLPLRAKQGLAQLEAGNITQPEIRPPTDQQQQRQQQTQAALKESYDKAIKLAPQIVQLANDAASDLAAGKWQAARPRQEEALQLLKEIAPKNPPDENQQDQQDDEKKDHEKKDQQEDQPDPRQEESDRQQDQQNQQQDEEKNDQQQQQKALSRQQAEALLSKARQREREHRERQKEQLRALQGTFRVDRDW